jgi:3-deoxy-D-manno-octulosonate 8-phosphate phosphatase (KDO 8-P phosphatase)
MSARVRRLSKIELARRARKVRLVLTDSDGVLTDTGVYYNETGEVMKRFSIRDGMGVERLRNAGIETAIITGELSESVRRRAAKLSLERAYLGVRNKREALDRILRETGWSLAEVAYIGDDVNDLECIEAVRPEGLTSAPADAMPEIVRRVHYRCAQRGGQGAFRDFAEWLLRLRT